MNEKMKLLKSLGFSDKLLDEIKKSKNITHEIEFEQIDFKIEDQPISLTTATLENYYQAAESNVII